MTEKTFSVHWYFPLFSGMLKNDYDSDLLLSVCLPPCRGSLHIKLSIENWAEGLSC